MGCTNSVTKKLISMPGPGEVVAGGVDDVGSAAASDAVTGMPPATAAAKMMALPLMMAKL